MNKQQLIVTIKGYFLDPKLEKTIIEYIENNDYNEKLVEDVAKMLENMADQANEAANRLQETLVMLDNFKEDLRKKAEEYMKMDVKQVDDYVNKVVDGIEEVKPSVVESMSEVKETPMEEVAPQEPAEVVFETPATQPSENTMPEMISPSLSQNSGEAMPVEPVLADMPVPPAPQDIQPAVAVNEPETPLPVSNWGS